jgi:hypothetical protein
MSSTSGNQRKYRQVNKTVISKEFNRTEIQDALQELKTKKLMVERSDMPSLNKLSREELLSYAPPYLMPTIYQIIKRKRQERESSKPQLTEEQDALLTELDAYSSGALTNILKQLEVSIKNFHALNKREKLEQIVLSGHGDQVLKIASDTCVSRKRKVEEEQQQQEEETTDESSVEEQPEVEQPLAEEEETADEASVEEQTSDDMETDIVPTEVETVEEQEAKAPVVTKIVVEAAPKVTAKVTPKVASKTSVAPISKTSTKAVAKTTTKVSAKAPSVSVKVAPKTVPKTATKTTTKTTTKANAKVATKAKTSAKSATKTKSPAVKKMKQ